MAHNNFSASSIGDFAELIAIDGTAEDTHKLDYYVGAPFVGAVAACLAISEVLRLLHGGPLHGLIDLDLQGPDYRTVLPHSLDFSALNPGFIAI